MENNEKYYGQVCQDEQVTEDFRKLHRDMVNMVLKFCAEHEIQIDELSLTADGLSGSIPYERWQACTDSSLSFYRYKDNTGKHHVEMKPYLWSI